MTEYRILEPKPATPAHFHAIEDGLIAFSDPRAGQGDWPDRNLCLVIRDEQGGIRGGLWGRFYYDWLFIELICVPENRRAEGLGSALLMMAEAQARAWGALGVWLDTFSFQARGFYEKHGYAVFGELPDFPPGHQRFFLARRLDPTGPARMVHPGIEPIAEPGADHRAAIARPLESFNDAALGGGSGPDETLCYTLETEDGQIAGGLWGRSYYRWLHIDLLFVPKGARGQGLGTALLRRAEAEARHRGCIGVWLDTFSFQAPDFYPRHGYLAFGRLDAYPGPHERTFFAKRLDGAA